MKKKSFFIFIVFIFIGNYFYSQTPLIDSLIRSVNSTRIDTLKVKLYGDIAWELLSIDINKSGIYAEKELELSKKINNKAFIAQAESDLGNILNRKGDFENSLTHYYNAVRLREDLKQPVKIAGIYSNIATALMRQNKYKEAMDVNFKSLKIFEETGDIGKQASILGNIGNIYFEMEQNSQAYIYHLRSLRLAKESKNPGLEANVLANVGGIKYENKEIDSALFYYYATEKILTENNLPYGLGATYNNIGKMLLAKNNLPKATEYYEKGLKNRIQFQDEYGIALSNLNLGGLYNKQKEYSKAVGCLTKSEAFFKKSRAYTNLKDCYLQLATGAEMKGDLNSSINYYKLWSLYKDSVYGKESTDQLLEMNAKYQTEKKEQENQVLNIQNKLSEKTIRQQRTFSYFIATALFLSACLAFFIFRGLKQQKKANLIISAQKKEVQLKSEIIEEKHKEITDSINYAERIQRALLASKILLDENLNEYFILFKPKDIVSGDFYWASKLSNNQFALVTADSTGHGVPGAIMSILNIACLKESVLQGITSPDLLLNETRKLIIENLKNDGSATGGKDGMDASLINIDFSENRLLCASANNPVWIVREGSLTEIKGDRMPVGKHDNDNTPFTLHTYNLHKGDMVYTLTDGFPDQFGGEKGKKFKYKQLQELLLSLSVEPMEVQKKKLNEAFTNWIGNLEQIDDVTVIGIRV